MGCYAYYKNRIACIHIHIMHIRAEILHEYIFNHRWDEDESVFGKGLQILNRHLQRLFWRVQRSEYYFGLLQVRFHLRLVIFQLLFALQFSVLVLTQLIQFTHSLPIGTARYRLYFLLLFLLRNSRKPKTNSTYKWSFRSDMIKAGIYMFIK